MSNKKPGTITPAGDGGVFYNLALRVKLVIRLLSDPRVSPLLKILPIGALFYLIIPDIAPGPVDDAAIVWLGTYLFVELCPPDIVQEHLEALSQVVQGEWQDPLGDEDEIIEAEFWEE